MPTLLNRFEIHDRIIDMIKTAETQLILISPYIKLHEDYKKALMKRIDDHELEITIVFGKNPEHKSKSMRISDMHFFKQLPNITIRYCEKLHAKLYANDHYTLLASMNLHSFSAETNFEAGVLCKASLIKDLIGLGGIISGLSKGSLDAQVFEFMETILNKYSPRIYFQRIPTYEKKFMNDVYLCSKTVKDCDDDFEPIKRIGYCIRTGQQIPFNPEKPFSAEGYKKWAEWENKNYKEKFCHFSGEPSAGQTSFAKPILEKNKIEAGLSFKD
jgi:phosphatidylserine/phosphatidylglycerophosphate/cardiolipin synthase-like enzyme